MTEKSAEKTERDMMKTGKTSEEEKRMLHLYTIENDKVVRQRPTCERCGLGYFMADHGDRFTCGHCGFTRYKPVDSKE